MGKIISLLDLKSGETGKVVELRGGPMFQRKVRIIGIREGHPLRVVSIQPIGGPVTVEVSRTKVTIGRGMAQRIFVEVA
ncbi:MAG: ferrous iron transport protein A [Candidatus Aenigmarchaeota archaeon]|nr:ferrous iron transport protein A [Candidatus Aenigmarchaeota archaeon]